MGAFAFFISARRLPIMVRVTACHRGFVSGVMLIVEELTPPRDDTPIVAQTLLCVSDNHHMIVYLPSARIGRRLFATALDDSPSSLIVR